MLYIDIIHGYNSKVFMKCAPRSEANTRQIAVTVPLSRKRQDLLMNAATAGSRFHATGGEYLNSDDYFISQERKQRSTKIEKLKTKKQDFEDKVHVMKRNKCIKMAICQRGGHL